MLVHIDTILVSLKVKAHGHERTNVAKVVGATSREGFLVIH